MNWEEETIPIADSNHFEILNGLWKGKKEPFIEAGVIRNTNFTPSGIIDYSNVAYLDVEEKQLSKRRLESGDIILERSGGGPKQPVGRVVYFDREDGMFSFSNFTSTIRVKDKSVFDPRFIFYGLMELYQSGQTEDIQRRTTGIRNLDFTTYKERARLPQIPLPEQKKIAHILSTVQRAIEAQEQIIQTTTELFKTMLHQLMTAQIRVSKENRDASSWRETQVKYLGEIVTGRTPRTERKDFYGGDYNLISPADLDKGKCIRTAHKRLTKLGFEQCRSLPKNTVLVGCIGNVGKLGMVSNEKSATNQQINALICNSENDPEFVYYCFYANRDNLEKRAVKTTVPILNKTNFGNFEVSVPPLPEQKKIAKILSTIQKKADNAQIKKTKLQTLFRTLLHELMTAKIRVNDFEINTIR